VPTTLSFEQLSVADGLAHSTVNCILQDSYGFMWFATDDGLNRYDGYEVTTYHHNPDDPHSLSHDRVWTLFEDANGVLWVGTYGGGLNRFDRDTERFTRYDADDFQNVTDEPEEFRNVVWAIDEHPAGVLWIATYGGGLVRLDQASGTFTSLAPDPGDLALGGHEWIRALLVDSSGMLWMGTDSVGLDRLNPDTGEIITYRHDPENPHSLGHDRITAIVQDRSGALWIGTDGGGLDRLDPQTGRFAHYRHAPQDPHSLSSDNIWSLMTDPAGRLWIGTFADGLDVFDPITDGFAHLHLDPADPMSLSSNRIRWIHRGPSGILWVGTQGGGVSKSDLASGRFTAYRGDPDDPERGGGYAVLALLADETGTMWIGTAGNGLDALDRTSDTWQHYRPDPADPRSLGNSTVRALHVSPSGAMWIGTDDGFYRFDRETGRFTRVPHVPPDPGDVKQERIYTIAEDRMGTLWLGTHGRGLSEYDPATGAFTYHLQREGVSASGARTTLSNNWVLDVLEGQSGMLWVGTREGLNVYDRETSRWRAYQHDPDDPTSLAHNWVASLYQDRDGMLWVGTLGGGLDQFDIASGAFIHYTEQDGLANNVVLDILEGGDYLWICTASGLSRYNPHSQTLRSYDATDGLPITECSTAYAGASGELTFGGVGGFASFYPDQITDNTYVPQVVVTSFQQNGVAVASDRAPENLRSVTLRWRDNAFEFGFATLNYTQPDKNQHAYKLDGFDSEWNYIGTRRFGRYTNLPGGTYTLRLKGSNNDGVWNEEGAALQIKVVPPAWQTGWFWTVAALTLAGAAFGGYRLRVRSLEARSHELEREVKARTAELRQEVDQRMQAETALRQQERQQVVSEERNRLARELHDSVTQALYGVTLYAEAAAGHLALGHTERSTEHLEAVQDTAQEALAEMRLLIFELRPPVLDEMGLAAALQARLQAVEGRAGVQTAFQTNLGARLPQSLEEGLYRIAVEALNNALKHAQAATITVRLHQQDAQGPVTLTIVDDGIGFDVATAYRSGGMGLAAIAERAAELGARLDVESTPGEGARVVVSVEEHRNSGELLGTRRSS
jgi:signal transduction histidine kinase/ligand-binding sensor domain-containing protein